MCRTLYHYAIGDGRMHVSRKHKMAGPMFPLWVAIRYLQHMADGDGIGAREYGKRFSHRLGQQRGRARA